VRADKGRREATVQTRGNREGLQTCQLAQSSDAAGESKPNRGSRERSCLHDARRLDRLSSMLESLDADVPHP
jgi:hypothetical protein